MEDKTNVIKIQRYHSPCGDLMLGSFEDKLCLCDWAAESHRDIVDRRLRKVLKAGYEKSTSDVILEAMSQLDEYFNGERTVFIYLYYTPESLHLQTPELHHTE